MFGVAIAGASVVGMSAEASVRQTTRVFDSKDSEPHRKLPI